MSVFNGLRPHFLLFFVENESKIKVLNYKRFVLLLRFPTVEIHKKKL